jgi:hypothetical protein
LGLATIWCAHIGQRELRISLDDCDWEWQEPFRTDEGVVDTDRLSRRRDKVFGEESVELDAAAKIEVDCGDSEG